MATFALGTALGDLTAFTMKIGFFSSAILFLVLICIPLVAHWKLRMNSVLAFWFAYTITRPLGASVSDWMGVSHRLGGLGLGRATTALILVVPILIAVAYMAISHVDIDRSPRGPAGPVRPAPVRARHRAI
jgi:uncharacterized membrane-anchored protein